jgi:hypothetical protein
MLNDFSRTARAISRVQNQILEAEREKRKPIGCRLQRLLHLVSAEEAIREQLKKEQEVREQAERDRKVSYSATRSRSLAWQTRAQVLTAQISIYRLG